MEQRCKTCGTPYSIKITAVSHNCDECFTYHFWQHHMLESLNSPKQHPVVNGNKYSIGPEEVRIGMRGYDGRKFVIRFDDGTVVTTTNLWYNGKVPERFKRQLPDNATLEEVHGT